MIYGGGRGGGQRSGRRRWLGGLIICVLPLALAGCAGASSGRQASRPTALASIGRLVLHLDVGDYSTTSSRANVRGSATRGAAVELNGDPVALRSGRWQRIVALHLGTNRIVVQASMRGHASVRRSITIRHRSPAELEAQALARQEVEVRATEAHEAEVRRTEAREAEAHARETEVASHEPQTGAECTDGTYVNSAGNTVCKPEQSPTVPAGATARCEDGTYSFSESRSGTCSHHGGVAEWLSG